MKLLQLTYTQHPRTSKVWSLSETNFSDVNLLVGKNASGKTKTLNIIHNLARLLCNKIKLNFSSGNYRAIFLELDKKYEYILEYRDKKITKELLKVGSKVVLKRGPGGKGKVYAEKIKRFVEFQTPVNELAAVSRRDEIQHSFFQELFEWGLNLDKFDFGSSMGKDLLFMIGENQSNQFPSLEVGTIIPLFLHAEKKYGASYVNAIKKHMKRIGYDIQSIKIGSPLSVTMQGANPFVVFVLKEKELGCSTDQMDMSQGMFRAFHVFVYLNYLIFSKKMGTIVIDDIGEGLDYERSVELIRILINESRKIDAQLLMATNDKFVMNEVPLEYWQVVKRKKGNVDIFNYRNRKKDFDSFKYTGLNNFDFFSTNFLFEE